MFPRLIFYCLILLLFFLYSGLVYSVGTSARDAISERPTAAILHGKQVFQSGGCVSCHQLYGLGGHLGPDLTNVISKPGFGPSYVRAVVSNGNGAMPGFDYSPVELDALVSFLTYVDSTGESPLRNFRVNSWGSLELAKPAG